MYLCAYENENKGFSRDSKDGLNGMGWSAKLKKVTMQFLNMQMKLIWLSGISIGASWDICVVTSKYIFNGVKIIYDVDYIAPKKCRLSTNQGYVCVKNHRTMENILNTSYSHRFNDI